MTPAVGRPRAPELRRLYAAGGCTCQLTPRWRWRQQDGCDVSASNAPAGACGSCMAQGASVRRHLQGVCNSEVAHNIRRADACRRQRRGAVQGRQRRGSARGCRCLLTVMGRQRRLGTARRLWRIANRCCLQRGDAVCRLCHEPARRRQHRSMHLSVSRTCCPCLVHAVSASIRAVVPCLFCWSMASRQMHYMHIVLESITVPSDLAPLG